MKRILTVSLSAVLLSGCTSLTMQLPTSRLDSPEVLGAGSRRFEMGLGSSSHKNVIFTDDASKRPPDLSKPRIELNEPLSGHLGLGVFENFEVGVRTSVGPSPWRFIGKLQLLGDSREKAKSGNFSLALTGGIGFAVSNLRGDQNGRFGPGGHNWAASVRLFMTEAALIAGYRLTDELLVYAGGFHAHHTINGRIEHQESDDGLSPQAEYKFEYGGYQTGANGGIRLELGSRAFMTVEGVYSKTKLSSTLEHEGVTVGGELGLLF